VFFAHKIALDLTHDQERYCRQAAGTARLTYKWGLAEWIRQYHAGEKPTALQLKKQWNAMKYERYPWLADIHRDAHAQPFANLQKAFATFFQNLKDRKAGKTRRKVGYPTFKKKGQHDSFYIANDKLQLDGKQLRIPQLGWVRMRESLRFTGKIMAAVVSRTADRWYVSVSVQVELPPRSCKNQAGRCGVDLGIRHLASLSNPRQHIDGPKPLKAALMKLRRMNRELARRVKFSANVTRRSANSADSMRALPLSVPMRCISSLRGWRHPTRKSSLKISMSPAWCRIGNWRRPSVIGDWGCFGSNSPTRLP